jgi:tRNA(His) guanylyltransferase
MLIMVGHINNLYNTTFWALIQLGGLDAKEAEKTLAVCSHGHIMFKTGNS